MTGKKAKFSSLGDSVHRFIDITSKVTQIEDTVTRRDQGGTVKENTTILARLIITNFSSVIINSHIHT